VRETLGRMMRRAAGLAAMVCAAGLSVGPRADDLPSVDHGRYMSPVEDAGPFSPVEPAVTARSGELVVKVSRAGKMQIHTGSDSYTIDSCFSYPGGGKPPEGGIGWNGLPKGFSQDNYPDVTSQRDSEPSWTPRVQAPSADAMTVQASGNCYRLLRTIKVNPGRIDISDELTSLRDVPTGIVPRHRITAREEYLDRYSVNLEVAANPTIYLRGQVDGLGIVMQDNLSRLRMRPWIPQGGNRAGFQVNRVVVGPRETRSLDWSIYPLEPGADYFSFINRVREDWNANFTIHGPFCFGYLKPEGDDIKFYLLYGRKEFYLGQVMADPTELREYLQWRGSRILALAPWPDHDPGAIDHVVSWDEYRQLMKAALPAFRAADPGLRIIACIETDWVAVDPAKMANGDEIPLPQQDRKYGPSVIQTLTARQSQIIEEAKPDWIDSLVRDAKGCLRIYHYYRGGAPINTPPLNVYPQVGNARYAYMMQQTQLALDELGMDGVYYDEFPMSQLGSVRTYEGDGDGASASIDFRTGELFGQYKDCSLAGIQARVNLIDYALSRGKTIIANRYSTSREEQSLPVNRFTETNSVFSGLTWELGSKPPALNYCFFSHLNSPIGLGAVPGPEGVPKARWLMGALITYLRHGMVMYNYGPAEPSMTAENRDVYGVVKHMYPITPVELGEGFIIAKERILAARSLSRLWDSAARPKALAFDVDGRQVDATGKCDIEAEGARWRVTLKLKDWSEIAVIE